MAPSTLRNDGGGEPYRDSLVLSANAGHALGLVQRRYSAVRLRARLTSTGPVAIVWAHTGPLGPDRPVGANCRLHPAALSRCIRFEAEEDGWSLVDGREGSDNVLSRGDLAWAPGESLEMAIDHVGDRLTLVEDGVNLFDGAVPGTGGCVGLLARSGAILEADRFEVSGDSEPPWVALSAFDATMGSGAAPDEWDAIRDTRLRFGEGCRSAREGVTGKWNYYGRGFRLWMPRGPGHCAARVLLDGEEIEELELSAATDGASVIVCERDTDTGYHAVTVVVSLGSVILDSLDYLSPDTMEGACA